MSKKKEMSERKRVHLVCNAHLDPVWLWPWNDGLAETMSTFAIAADFCDSVKDFVFCHNESLLYQWVEKHEPELFSRIKKHVKAGRWNIAGGAFVQPDLVSPTGESMIRQFLEGRRYFTSKFKKYPETAYNFDSFGHPAGLPQILSGCGMKNYVFCRPGESACHLPIGSFIWKDRSGEAVVARRSDDHYLTNYKIAEQLDEFLKHYKNENATMILWGLGNHGGGATKEELDLIDKYREEHPEYEIIHSTPDAFFRELLKDNKLELPVVDYDLHTIFPGCYTSMSMVKRAHRHAESMILTAERFAALNWWINDVEYPKDRLHSAWQDLMFCEFHDILPGSMSITPEKDSLNALAKATDEAHRIVVENQIDWIKKQEKAESYETPYFVTNPHGFPVKTNIDYEIQLHHSWPTNPEIELRVDGKKIAYQRSIAEAVCANDWRVRLLTTVSLKPFETLRIEESFKQGKEIKIENPKPSKNTLFFKTSKFDLRINQDTGLVDKLSLPGSRKSIVKPGSFEPVVLKDIDHSWDTHSPEAETKSKPVNGVFDGKYCTFNIAKPEDVLKLSPTYEVHNNPSEAVGYPIRIIESGCIRTTVEVIFVCGESALVRQYMIGHIDNTFEIRDRIFWNHRDSMLKLYVPLNFNADESVAETLHSASRRKPTEKHVELSATRWVAVCGKSGNQPLCMSVANDGIGAYALTQKNDMFLNVTRSPAYSSFGLSAEKDNWRMRKFLPRQDIGQQIYSYKIMVSECFNETEITKCADLLNMPIVGQTYFPRPSLDSKNDFSMPVNPVSVSSEDVLIRAIKRSEKGSKLIIRLLNTSNKTKKFSLKVYGLEKPAKLSVKPYKLLTVAVKKSKNKVSYSIVNLVEEK